MFWCLAVLNIEFEADLVIVVCVGQCISKKETIKEKKQRIYSWKTTHTTQRSQP